MQVYMENDAVLPEEEQPAIRAYPCGAVLCGQLLVEIRSILTILRTVGYQDA